MGMTLTTTLLKLWNAARGLLQTNSPDVQYAMIQDPSSLLRDPWRWDRDHVHMPCSPSNRLGRRDKMTRWELIEQVLTSRNFTDSHELENAIKLYNVEHAGGWNFRALHAFSRDEGALFRQTVPKIIALALRLPTLVNTPIPLLRQGLERELSLNQDQIAVLLANACLCTFPLRNNTRFSADYKNFPSINFTGLFMSDAKQSNVEKIKCLFHYFNRVHDKPSIGTVTYTRRCMEPEKLPAWDRSAIQLPKLIVSSDGTIETSGRDMLQVDFANKLVGGGVLGNGCVQEEIRFVTNPELIAARIFTEELRDNEALLIQGTECYSRHTGYSDTFRWAGDLRDNTPRDRQGRMKCAIVAIDATRFDTVSPQYEASHVTRELNKAYIGFNDVDGRRTADLHTVATGNWGCGAFNGEPILKALIQLMAAAQAQRSLRYFTFGDEKLATEIREVHRRLVERQVTVGKLFRTIKDFRNDKSRTNLLNFIDISTKQGDELTRGIKRSHPSDEEETILSKRRR